MRKLKTLSTGLVLGLIVGLWFGFNIGKGRTIYANPLTDPRISGQVEQGSQEAGESLEQAGEKVRDEARDQRP